MRIRVDSKTLAAAAIVFAVMAVSSIGPGIVSAGSVAVISNDSTCRVDLTAETKQGATVPVVPTTGRQSLVADGSGLRATLKCHIRSRDLGTDPPSRRVQSRAFLCTKDGAATVYTRFSMGPDGKGIVRCRFSDFPPI